MRSNLRRAPLLLTAVLVLAACSEHGSTDTAVPAAASSAPSTPSSGTANQADDCAAPSAESTVLPTQAGGSSTTGILQGHMYGVGGPAPGLHEAWSGTVTITGSTVHREINLGPDGAYAVALPPGEYDIEGRSPHFGGCTYSCHARGPDSHRVLAGKTTTLDTYCSMS
jgi:hypothetical protein